MIQNERICKYFLAFLNHSAYFESQLFKIMQANNENDSTMTVSLPDVLGQETFEVLAANAKLNGRKPAEHLREILWPSRPSVAATATQADAA